MIKLRIIAVLRNDMWESYCLETGESVKAIGQSANQSIGDLINLIKQRISIVCSEHSGVCQMSRIDDVMLFESCSCVKYYPFQILVWNVLLFLKVILRLKNVDVLLITDYRAFKKKYSP